MGSLDDFFAELEPYISSVVLKTFNKKMNSLHKNFQNVESVIADLENYL